MCESTRVSDRTRIPAPETSLEDSTASRPFLQEKKIKLQGIRCMLLRKLKINYWIGVKYRVGRNGLEMSIGAESFDFLFCNLPLQILLIALDNTLVIIQPNAQPFHGSYDPRVPVAHVRIEL